jgi:hypothetical protein
MLTKCLKLLFNQQSFQLRIFKNILSNNNTHTNLFRSSVIEYNSFVFIRQLKTKMPAKKNNTKRKVLIK